jgi:hypothetical protein
VTTLAVAAAGLVLTPRPASSGGGPHLSAETSLSDIAAPGEAMTWDESVTGGDDDQLDASGETGAEFQTDSQTWERTELTYGFDNWTSGVTHTQMRTAVAGALNSWAEVGSLTFTEGGRFAPTSRSPEQPRIG